jgi:diguanylate cyclase (GGDEF)-like protein
MVDLINMHLRENDVFARLGGKEFGLLLPKTDMERSANTAEKLREAVENMETYTDSKLTVTVGLLACTDMMNAQELIARLEQLVIKAKEAGKNQVIAGKSEDVV